MAVQRRGLGSRRFVLEVLSYRFEVSEPGPDSVVVVGSGELGWSFTDEQDQGAVGSDGVGAAVVGSSCSPTVAVFEPVVRSALGPGVGLVGASAVGVRLVVVDLAAVGGISQPVWLQNRSNRVAAMRALPVNRRLRSPKSITVERASSTTRRTCAVSNAWINSRGGTG